MSLNVADDTPAPLCEWVERGLRELAGQDPLGLQTITTDRILPVLLPGVLALSVRARYFSIYPFLLRVYERRRVGRSDNHALSDFMRKREYELCLACNLCARCDAESAVGNFLARPLVAQRPAAYARRGSVQSQLGGYGLYYRSPMEELGLVVPAGRGTFRDEPNPIDLATVRADPLADAFEQAIAETAWYREHLHGIDPIPAEVLEELAEAACLCRLDESLAEREQIRRVLLSAGGEERREAAEQRRRAFALLLDLMSAAPEVAISTAAFREAVIAAFLRAPQARSARNDAQAQWAAVAMRECMQEAVCSLWHDFCRSGWNAQPFEGFSPSELRHLVHAQMTGGATLESGDRRLSSDPGHSAVAWCEELAAALGERSWDQVAAWAAEQDTALAGLAALALLVARTPDPAAVNPSWSRLAEVDGDHQRGLLNTAATVRRKLASAPSLGELMHWTITTFVVAPHETIAMGKLPDSTFRFWWEDGRLRFVDNGIGRFDVSGLRRDALASLGLDLGWWSWEGDRAEPTKAGLAVVAEVLG
jgi:hypothetical protein